MSIAYSLSLSARRAQGLCGLLRQPCLQFGQPYLRDVAKGTRVLQRFKTASCGGNGRARRRYALCEPGLLLREKLLSALLVQFLQEQDR